VPKTKEPKPTVESLDKPKELLQPVPIRDNQISTWFEYHKPDEEAISDHARIRAHAGSFAQVIKMTTRNCPDQQRAIAACREAMYWANAAIACKGK